MPAIRPWKLTTDKWTDSAFCDRNPYWKVDEGGESAAVIDRVFFSCVDNAKMIAGELGEEPNDDAKRAEMMDEVFHTVAYNLWPAHTTGSRPEPCIIRSHMHNVQEWIDPDVGRLWPEPDQDLHLLYDQRLARWTAGGRARVRPPAHSLT